MVHFLTNLQYYVMFEVLESSWKVLQDEVQPPLRTKKQKQHSALCLPEFGKLGLHAYYAKAAAGTMCMHIGRVLEYD